MNSLLCIQILPPLIIFPCLSLIIILSLHLSQGMPPIHDVRLRWRTVMLMIVGHLDSKVPVTRVVCVTLDQLPAAALPNATMITSSTGSNEEVVPLPSESLLMEVPSPESSQIHQAQRVVMDIEAIKWCNPDQPSIPGQEQELDQKEPGEQRKLLQPVIFVRYTVTGNALESREAIDDSAKELSDLGINQKRISCSLDEIQYAASLLQEQEACVDEAYRTKWMEKSALNGTVFRLSLLRPTLEPLFPYRTAELKRQVERQARKEERSKQRARHQLWIQRMMKLQGDEEQLRRDEVDMRRDRGELVDRVCSKPGCEELALLQCPRCPNACYCRVKRKSIGYQRPFSYSVLV